ncbi:hypothetical protein [Nonomuraea harbinensis]|uniref:HNH endonuclease n=1 Tax=Nonomuraea harbinensis TaxID=1286938 RepID=A0ABW1C1L2_9ACTN|nr:hypothetical protein [Nonomuraea harbinensis]
MRTIYREASRGVPLADIPHVWRTDHSLRGPFNRKGGVKQGYLFRVDEVFFERFIERFGHRFSDAPVVLSAEAKDSAPDLLRRLLGREITTLKGGRSRIIDIRPPYVLVATERSPKGEQILIADVEVALEDLRARGRVQIHPTEVGDYSAFIEALLLTLPGVEAIDGTPPVIAVRFPAVSGASTSSGEALTYEGDLNRPVTAAQRREQSALRQLLFGAADTAACALCGKIYPIRFLIAAHIKMRSLCSDEERRDLANIAMPACQFGCDALYEAGYISVDSNGVIVSSAVEENSALSERLKSLTGRLCLSFSDDSRRYFQWHLSTRFRD